MAKKRRTIGCLPPRYSFILNPHSDFRLSRCPQCKKLTHQRKFPLFIVIKGGAAMVIGKTCKYCTPCELILAFQDEVEAEMAIVAEKFFPDAIGHEYLVVGTMDKQIWKAGLDGKPRDPQSMLEHLADFKTVLNLEVDRGGWRPA